MKTFFLAVFLMVHCAVSNASAQQEQASPTQPEQASDEATEKVEPKFFIWGMLVRAVASEAFSMFGKWLINHISNSAKSGKMPLQRQEAAPVGISTGAALGQPAATVEGSPDVAFKFENGQVNYQGVHIAVAVLDKSDNQLRLRPLSAGFHSGERFKLRVLATFNGQLQIDNINPKGERRQIYPAEPGSVVSLQAGQDTLIPQGIDDYFEFARTTGEEQLVITLHDPRATQETSSKSKVFVKNETYGSNFLQQVGTNSYPVISESIRLLHY